MQSPLPQYHQKLIQTFWWVKGLLLTGQISFRMLQALTLTYIFHCSLTTTVFYLGVLQLLVMAFEIPTGIVGDALGRKRSFLLSALCYTGSSLVVALTVFYEPLVPLGIFSFLVGGALGWTFQSGALEAWITHNLKLSGYQGEFHRIFATREAIRNLAGLVIGPIFIIGFYRWHALPWFLAAFFFFGSSVLLFLATYNLQDHEVGHHRWPPLRIFWQSAKDIVIVSSKALNSQPLLRAWIAITSGKTLTIAVLVKFYPLWFDRLPGQLWFFGLPLSREHLISAALAAYLGANLLGSVLARQYSYQASRFYRFGFLMLLSVLPLGYFFFPISASLEISSAFLFIVVFAIIGAAGIIVELIGEGQYSHTIETDAVRNTLMSTHSLIKEGIPGVFLVLWGFLPIPEDNLRLLFRATLFLAIILMVYGVRIIGSTNKSTFGTATVLDVQ